MKKQGSKKKTEAHYFVTMNSFDGKEVYLYSIFTIEMTDYYYSQKKNKLKTENVKRKHKTYLGFKMNLSST